MTLWKILVGTWWRITKDNVSALAAAVAFYAFFSIFPTLTAVVSLYGLVADPRAVAGQATSMVGVLPLEVITFIVTWLDALLKGPPVRFGAGLIISLMLAFWSAWSATAMLMTAVNICYGREDKRSFITFNLRAVAVTVGLAFLGIAALALLTILPVVLSFLPVPEGFREITVLARWSLLAVIVLAVLAIVFHYAPDRPDAEWRFISWGAAGATGLWILASIAFTVYVSDVASYDRTYGSLGAVIILLLWFYLSAYVTLLGAELNAEIDRQLRLQNNRELNEPVEGKATPGR